MSIPLHLVTGFLGSGKTTFLKYYLEQKGADNRIAIVQNEFSPVNIDGKAFTSKGDYQVLEINNGSVFCVCLLGSFVGSLLKFIEAYSPDLILMETSGLSDTIGVGQIFQSAKLQGKVYLAHVWCLVDAKHYDRVPALKLRLDHQLRSADTIMLNKVDLLENSDSLAAALKQINPFARILKSRYGKIDVDDPKRAKKLFPLENAEALGRPDIGSYVIKSNAVTTEEKFNTFWNHFSKDCLRCKGYVNLNNGHTLHIQGVMEDIETEEVENYSGITEFVMIGNFKKGINLQSVFDECCRI